MPQSTELGYYIQKTSHLITLIANEKLAELGITLSQMRVLRCLWEQDGLTQREIQECLLIKSSSVNGLLEQLLKKGFVRKAVDPLDGRSNRIRLTGAGQILQEKCLDIFAELELTVSQGLTTGQKQDLIERLEGVFRNFSTLYAGDSVAVQLEGAPEKDA